MKNFILTFLFLSSIFMSCSEGTSGEVENLIYFDCPRTNLESNAGVTQQAQELATELTAVINCGRAFHIPHCKEGSPNLDQATVVVEVWCSPFNSCVCNFFPNGFTITDQDALIEKAISLLGVEMNICGLARASYVFKSEALPPVSPCDGFRIQLTAKATAFCCGVVE